MVILMNARGWVQTTKGMWKMRDAVLERLPQFCGFYLQESHKIIKLKTQENGFMSLVGKGEGRV